MKNKGISTLGVAIAAVVNTNPYENLPIIAGQCGRRVYELVEEASKADKELDILHECITELYNIDTAAPIIKKYLNKIDKIQP